MSEPQEDSDAQDDGAGESLEDLFSDAYKEVETEGPKKTGKSSSSSSSSKPSARKSKKQKKADANITDEVFRAKMYTKSELKRLTHGLKDTEDIKLPDPLPVPVPYTGNTKEFWHEVAKKREYIVYGVTPEKKVVFCVFHPDDGFILMKKGLRLKDQPKFQSEIKEKKNRWKRNGVWLPIVSDLEDPNAPAEEKKRVAKKKDDGKPKEKKKIAKSNGHEEKEEKHDDADTEEAAAVPSDDEDGELGAGNVNVIAGIHRDLIIIPAVRAIIEQVPGDLEKIRKKLEESGLTDDPGTSVDLVRPAIKAFKACAPKVKMDNGTFKRVVHPDLFKQCLRLHEDPRIGKLVRDLKLSKEDRDIIRDTSLEYYSRFLWALVCSLPQVRAALSTILPNSHGTRQTNKFASTYERYMQAWNAEADPTRMSDRRKEIVRQHMMQYGRTFDQAVADLESKKRARDESDEEGSDGAYSEDVDQKEEESDGEEEDEDEVLSAIDDDEEVDSDAALKEDSDVESEKENGTLGEMIEEYKHRVKKAKHRLAHLEGERDRAMRSYEKIPDDRENAKKAAKKKADMLAQDVIIQADKVKELGSKLATKLRAWKEKLEEKKKSKEKAEAEKGEESDGGVKSGEDEKEDAGSDDKQAVEAGSDVEMQSEAEKAEGKDDEKEKEEEDDKEKEDEDEKEEETKDQEESNTKEDEGSDKDKPDSGDEEEKKDDDDPSPKSDDETPPVDDDAPAETLGKADESGAENDDESGNKSD